MGKESANKSPTAAAGKLRSPTKNDYVTLADMLEGKESFGRVLKKDSHGDALRETGQFYENREFVNAYERFKPVHEKVMADMQRLLARNVEFEANKLATRQRIALTQAKQEVEKLREHAAKLIEQMDILFDDLKHKPVVRLYVRKLAEAPVPAEQANESQSTTRETTPPHGKAVDGPKLEEPHEIVVGDARYSTRPFSNPEPGILLCVRDKARGETVIRVVKIHGDSAEVEVETIDRGQPTGRRLKLAVESLKRQAAKGWCYQLLPKSGLEKLPADADQTRPADDAGTLMRLDSQNFGRCCGDIMRAKIKFSTQLIKDVGDGPFRAGNFEQAFLTFEQLAVGFNSAVANSRREIADGRRMLNAQKAVISGKEVQERTAAFVRSEQLIHTAEREFATILEGLRMYLRATQAGTDDEAQ